ncbi:RNA12 protein-domain-containing protein, partial [Lipomyces starkeyi]
MDYRKVMAKDEDIRYNELLLNPLFKNAKDVIAALEHAELITVLEKDGRPYKIKAGRPIYRAAYQRLLNDKRFSCDTGDIDLDSYIWSSHRVDF